MYTNIYIYAEKERKNTTIRQQQCRNLQLQQTCWKLGTEVPKKVEKPSRLFVVGINQPSIAWCCNVSSLKIMNVHRQTVHFEHHLSLFRSSPLNPSRYRIHVLMHHWDSRMALGYGSYHIQHVASMYIYIYIFNFNMSPPIYLNERHFPEISCTVSAGEVGVAMICIQLNATSVSSLKATDTRNCRRTWRFAAEGFVWKYESAKSANPCGVSLLATQVSSESQLHRSNISYPLVAVRPENRKPTLGSEAVNVQAAWIFLPVILILQLQPD